MACALRRYEVTDSGLCKTALAIYLLKRYFSQQMEQGCIFCWLAKGC
ncbi:MAG: hypothetical protein P8X74_01160 [Reinekea sp.]